MNSARMNSARMNYQMIQRLILKDWYLQRKTIFFAVFGGAIAIAIICLCGKPGFFIGLLLMITALISVGAQLAISTMVSERKEQTLPFLMSLPISYREYTAAKLLANLLLFLIPWLLLVLASLALFAIPHGIPHGLLPFTVIMAVEIFVSTCLVVATALVSESQGWTIAAIMVGNIAINVVGYAVAHVPSIASGMDGALLHWTPAATTLLLTEFLLIVAILAGTFLIQSRKKDYL